MKGTSLEVQWLRHCLPMKWVRALVRELRPHMLQDMAKIKKKKKTLKNPLKSHNEKQYKKIHMCVCVYLYMIIHTHTHTHTYAQLCLALL